MIKFFRKIRQNLLNEEKTTKYFKYATGEIVLVVIGILIALHINNWNEQRKIKANIYSVLKQIHTELSQNIKRADKLALFYQEKDIEINAIMNNEIENVNRGYDNPIRGNEVMIIKDQGFENLMRYHNDIPANLDSLVNTLKELFVKHKEQVEYSNNTIDKSTLDYDNWLKLNAPWYKEGYFYSRDSISNAQLDFYLSENSLFKNFVKDYYDYGVRGHYSSILRFRYYANKAYIDLTKILEIEDRESFSFKFSNSEKEKIIGNFQKGGYTWIIKEENNKFYLVSDSSDEEQIFFLNDSTFIMDRPENWYFKSLDLNDSKNVLGFTFRTGNRNYKWVKTRSDD